MTILVLADDDTVERKISDDHADVLISCGDLTDAMITRVATRVGATTILAVKGNHDSSGRFANPIMDLHLKDHELNGIRFGGFAGSWRYKPVGNYLFDQEEVTALLEAFLPVDVFVSHNSPRRVHDRDDMVHLGFDAFAEYIQRARPRLFIHGHRHVNRKTPMGDTLVIGVYGFQRIEIGK